MHVRIGDVFGGNNLVGKDVPAYNSSSHLYACTHDREVPAMRGRNLTRLWRLPCVGRHALNRITAIPMHHQLR